jgi:GAF domain-containing protein
MTTQTIAPSDIDAGPTEQQRSPGSWRVGMLGSGADPFTTEKILKSFHVVLRSALSRFDADGSGILLAADGDAIAAVASGSRSSRAEALQVEHHQGPALQAIRGRQPVLSGELRLDGRWRSWSPRAAELGFRSVLSLPLADGNPFGAITIYSLHRSFFGGVSLAPGLALAHHASMLITAAAADSRPGITGIATSSPQRRHHDGVRS